jgi:hypothetical protein
MHPDPIELLNAQNAQLQQQNAQLSGLLHQRAEPLWTAVLDATTTLIAMAEQGHPQAREMLGKWVRAQDAARELVHRSPLTVPHGSVPRA